MKPVAFSALAKADLKALKAEGVKLWGDVRNRRYLDDLERCFATISAHPRRYPLVGLARPDIRRIRSGSHIIFYRDEPARIVIVRVLHEKQQQTNRL